MSKVSVLDSDATINPIDLVEDVAGANVWASDRQSADELAIQITGQWCDMQMWFAWRPQSHSLFITCALDMRVPEGSRGSLESLAWLRGQITDPERLARVAALQPLAEQMGATLAQFSIAWCLQNPWVSTVITGASRVEQVHENMKAVEVAERFTPDLLAAIDEIFT